MSIEFNLQEENRNGYIVSSEMKEVWDIQLSMVKELLRVCELNNLKIWADGGTLLGVVREHGYIPWDDDIDMLMLREDYDKLVSIAPEEFKAPFYFQSAHTERNYFRGHAQLRYDGTTAILPGDVYQSFHQGIFVDIFVYDSIPDREDEIWKNKLKRAEEIESILKSAHYPGFYVVSLHYTIKSLRSKFKCMFGGAMKLFNEYENLFRGYSVSENKRIACPCFNRKIFKTATKNVEWYSNTIWMPFENIELPVPCGYDMVLRTQYGDNYLTPRKAPSMHGGFLVLNARKSYTEYLGHYRKEFNRLRWKDRREQVICKFRRNE